MPLIFSRLSMMIKQGFMDEPLWFTTRLSYHISASTLRHPVHVFLEYLRFFANIFVWTVLTDLLAQFGCKVVYIYFIRWCMSEIIFFV